MSAPPAESRAQLERDRRRRPVGLNRLVAGLMALIHLRCRLFQEVNDSKPGHDLKPGLCALVVRLLAGDRPPYGISGDPPEKWCHHSDLRVDEPEPTRPAAWLTVGTRTRTSLPGQPGRGLIVYLGGCMFVHPRLAAVAVSVLTIGAVGVLGSPASADDRGHDTDQHVWVNLQGDGSTAKVSSDEVRPGVVSFTVKGSATAGGSVVVVSLRNGGKLRQFLTDLTTVSSQSSQPPDVITAINDLDKIAVAYGGGDILAGQSVTDTVRLPDSGDYYLVNTPNNGASVSLATIEAHGRSVSSGNPDYSATVTLGDGTNDIITTKGELPRHGTIRVTNHGNVIHLLQMTKVADGVTDAQVQAEYDQLLAGQQPNPDPAERTPPNALPQRGISRLASRQLTR